MRSLSISEIHTIPGDSELVQFLKSYDFGNSSDFRNSFHFGKSPEFGNSSAFRKSYDLRNACASRNSHVFRECNSSSSISGGRQISGIRLLSKGRPISEIHLISGIRPTSENVSSDFDLRNSSVFEDPGFLAVVRFVKFGRLQELFCPISTVPTVWISFTKEMKKQRVSKKTYFCSETITKHSKKSLIFVGPPKKNQHYQKIMFCVCVYNIYIYI